MDFVKMAKQAGVNPNDPDALALFVKDVITGSRPASGWLYENGPFSYVADDPISAVINNGSPLLAWIPTRLVDYRFPDIAHISWVAPEGFDGSETYSEFLRVVADSITECDYGPAADWSGFEYQLSGAEFSFKSEVLHLDDFGMRDYQKTPIVSVRGDALNMPLTNDAEWATARAVMLVQQHMNYLIVNGDSANSAMEFDGLSKILTPGYVASKVVGPGNPVWSDPLVINAAGVTDPVVILSFIRGLVRKIRDRVSARQWSLMVNDMAIVMPGAMWNYIADAHASGGNVGFVTTNFTGRMSYAEFLSERSRIMQGGVGYGFIDVDGTPVPVIPDGNLGRNTTIDPNGTPLSGVTGDIMILTRRAGGLTLLEQQYVNWDALRGAPVRDEKRFTVQGGLIRSGWINENNKCFQYYAEARGRLVSSLQPLQARINNVSLATLLENENEGTAFWSPDFYAYDGAQGGGGVALLNPL